VGAALIIAAPAMAEMRLTPSVRVSETFSDNVDQDPDGLEDEAFLTDVTPGATLRYSGARVNGSLDAFATLRHQNAGDDKGIDAIPSVAGFGEAEAIPETLFLNASASLSSELLNTRGNDTESNKTTVQNYSVGPTLRHRFGNFADGEVSYSFDQQLNSGGGNNLSDSRAHSGSVVLSSGTDFAKILWSLNASASQSERQNDDNVSRRAANVDLEYVVFRSFSLLGSGGYEKFDDGDPGNDVNGATWQAGFRWRPGPRTEISLEYGENDGDESFTGDLRYQITPRTTLRASYSEQLTVGQERLVQDLSFIGTDPNTGALIDTRTGLPFDPNASTTTLSNDTERTKVFRLALLGSRGRNTFSVSGSVEKTDQRGVGTTGDENAYTFDLGWTRRISPRANIDFSGSFERNEFELNGREDTEFSVGGGYSYNLYTNITAFAQYTFSKQFSDVEANEFTENLVTVGLNMSF